AEIPSVVLAGDAGPARAGIRRNQHQAVLSGMALRARLDHEGFLGAGQAGQEEQHRHTALLRLGRQKDGETHGQADGPGSMAIIALDAIEAAMLAEQFKIVLWHHGVSLRRPGPRWPGISTPPPNGWTRRASSARSLR